MQTDKNDISKNKHCVKTKLTCQALNHEACNIKAKSSSEKPWGPSLWFMSTIACCLFNYRLGSDGCYFGEKLFTYVNDSGQIPEAWV